MVQHLTHREDVRQKGAFFYILFFPTFNSQNQVSRSTPGQLVLRLKGVQLSVQTPGKKLHKHPKFVFFNPIFTLKPDMLVKIP